MNRRQADLSESSAVSSTRTPSLQLLLEQSLKLESCLNRKDELKRLLSTRSHISTTSSFAIRQEEAAGTDVPWREIGLGSRGRVFEQPGTDLVYKLAITDEKILWNDYKMHQLVIESFEEVPFLATGVSIPLCHWFTHTGDMAFWNQHLSRLPADFRQPRDTICSQRILPVPQVIRELLIDEYCKDSLKTQAKTLDANKDCLVRLYLGKRRASDRPNALGFSLRNFALHLDQMESLGLDIGYYTRNMADILAVFHFKAKMDADDIDIVLGTAAVGSPRKCQPLSSAEIGQIPAGQSTREESSNMHRNFKKRTIHLWVLDFNACKPITMNEQGINAAVKSFWDNSGQYFPRPVRELPRDHELWQLFSSQYLESCRKLIDIEDLDQEVREKRHKLPKMFLNKVVDAREKELENLRLPGQC